MLYLLFVSQLKVFNQLITNKTERFSFKNGRAVQVAKLIIEDWPIVYSKDFNFVRAETITHYV